MKKLAFVKYNHDYEFISFKNADLEISTILSSYDDIIKLINFDNGLLTVLMKQGDCEIEEYVDFAHALDLLDISERKKDYFDGISLNNIKLIRE